MERHLARTTWCLGKSKMPPSPSQPIVHCIVLNPTVLHGTIVGIGARAVSCKTPIYCMIIMWNIKALSFLSLGGRWHECALNDRMMIIHLSTPLCHCSGRYYCANTNMSRIITECAQVNNILLKAYSLLKSNSKTDAFTHCGKGF